MFSIRVRFTAANIHEQTKRTQEGLTSKTWKTTTNNDH